MQSMKKIMLSAAIALAPFTAGANDVFGECVLQDSKTFDAKTLSLTGVYQILAGDKAISEQTAQATALKVSLAKSCRDINLLLVDVIKAGLENSK